MRTSIFLVVGLFVVATMASAAMFAGNITSAATDDGPTESSGTFEFYYHGAPQWQWIFFNGGYAATNFDPANSDDEGLGDSTTNGYEVTYVDSRWDPCGEGEYTTRLRICADDGGVPDFDNPLYDTGDYVPATSGMDEQEIDPPVMFLGGEICWTVYDVILDDAFEEPWDGIPGGHPVSDGDGGTGHSWQSGDGYTWELMSGSTTGEVDFLHKLFGEPVESVETSSFGHIKSYYQ